MIFDRLFKRTSFSNGNNKGFSSLRLRPNKKESARLSLEEANKLIADKKYKQALKAINTSLENKISTNQLLLKKAFLLSENNQHNEAQEILRVLAKLKNKTKLATAAQDLLISSQENQQKNKKKLIRAFQQKAKKYAWKLKYLAKPEDYLPNTNIAQSVRKEAQRARAANLPKLSTELINLALKAGHKSPWLVHDKALSLSMMGRKREAIKCLEGLRKTIKNPKTQSAIRQSMDTFNKTSKEQKQELRTYMAEQARRIAKANQLDILLIPKKNEFNNQTNLEGLILKQAHSALPDNPTATLNLTNAILDYFPENGWALQKKGEALTLLNQLDKATEILTSLIHTENEKLANLTCKTFTKLLSKKANLICSKQSPKAAISFFISQHLQYKLTPAFYPELKNVLKQIETPSNEFLNSELEQHQLQLLFNTLLIDHIEAQLCEQGRLNATAPSQRIGAISETAPKAG